ncbi:MAG: hypothetical protein ACLRQF_10045 [Thomasclavelia ramosa]
MEEKCVDYASEGYRILVLAHTDEVMSNEAFACRFRAFRYYCVK